MSLANPPVETVLVQCIWPESRGAKNDCQNHTKVVWAGHGDIQAYPKALVGKLINDHPTVWRLVDPDAEAKEAERTAQAAVVAAQNAIHLAEEAKARAEAAKRSAADRVAAQVQALKDAEAERAGAAEALAAAEADRIAAELGTQTNTDVVLATALPVQFTAEMLADMPDADVRAEAQKRSYGLHPRLGPEKLRVEFLACQAAAETSGA
jgi:MoxR-like ATPase